MSRKSTPKERAKADMKVARGVLAHAGVTDYMSVVPKEKPKAGRMHWVLENTSHLEIWQDSEPLAGRWSLELQLVYDADPEGDAVFVNSGSIGLKRELDDGRPRSFLRYDIDVAKPVAIGESCHLHAIQVAPFHDRIHLRLPGIELEEWKLGPTLEYLCSGSLRDELRSRYE